jgi:maltose O-acetyltransferase
VTVAAVNRPQAESNDNDRHDHARVAPRLGRGRRWWAGLRREAASLSSGVNLRWGLIAPLAALLPTYCLCSLRARLYRLAGCSIEGGVTIQGGLRLLGKGTPAARLHVATGSIVAPGVLFGLDAPVRLGRNVSVGPAAAFHTATHAIGFGSRRMQLETSAHPITVEDGAWIGAHCVILPGVTVGHGSVVAAGAVVAEDVPPDVFIAGNPAQIRTELPFGQR